MIDLQSTCDDLAASEGDIHHCTGANFNDLAAPQQSTLSLLI